MKNIVSDYLLNLLCDCIKTTIHYRRKMVSHQGLFKTDDPTNEEIIDFVYSIPYFDEGLKDFMLEHLQLHAIIIDDTWEQLFIKKSIAWAIHPDWTQTDLSFLNGSGNEYAGHGLLSLPY